MEQKRQGGADIPDTDLQTLDVVCHLSLIQLVDEIRLVCVAPLLLKGIKHHSTEFLHIVLLPSCTKQESTSHLCFDNSRPH